MSDATSRLEFIIVGASVSGLASAIGLKASGHRVRVLEKDLQLGGIGSVPNGSGCAQVPPNGCKILSDWGLDAELQANSAPISGFTMYKYDAAGSVSPDFIGVNLWDEEMLSEARGGYMQLPLSHRELVRILYEFAVKPTEEHPTPLVSVLFGQEVVSVDCNACSVTLRSGEIHSADGILGADGARGVVRRALKAEEEALPDSDVWTGISAYRSVSFLSLAAGIDQSYQYRYPECTTWITSQRAARTFPVGKDRDLSLLVYTPDSSQDPTWTEEAEKKLVDVLGTECDAHLRKLAALAGTSTCVQIKDHGDLDSWVSESGRVLAIGDAAHPFPPGALHSYSCSLEDGVFVGKLFSHTQSADRIPEFMRAFQEHRESRCTHIRDGEKEILRLMMLPEGPEKIATEVSMRKKQAAGRNVLEGDLESLLDDFITVFSYDARDDADEYWMAWGRYRDDGSLSSGPLKMAFTSFEQQFAEGSESESEEDLFFVSKKID
ncbi:hypothetical protein FB45DRAFT_902293 [Roridomyces roridus]|uniref:FAD-binding domain-containing protein n=1 Tax=Roridomyces roridus TaxID=1738132 RepID=A0AAD7C3E7_9AGAR|nr:hypothetical protein FB45DRAFT_902293 [Roridomyces roridus]